MLKSLLNRLSRIEKRLNPPRVETIVINWYRDHIDVPPEAYEPPAPGVQRVTIMEYAPPGVEVDWNPEEGWYPPLEFPSEDKGQEPAAGMTKSSPPPQQ